MDNRRRSGAGGSWIQIGDKYIVAGGGFGKPQRAHNGGAGGGAIGGGGSGDDYSGAYDAGRGGWGGNKYKGGYEHGNRTGGNPGDGLDGIGGGRGGGEFVGGNGEGGKVKVERLYAGYNTTIVSSGVMRLGGSAYSGESARASHVSNVNYKLACQDDVSGCSALYKFNNEVK